MGFVVICGGAFFAGGVDAIGDVGVGNESWGGACFAGGVEEADDDAGDDGVGNGADARANSCDAMVTCASSRATFNKEISSAAEDDAAADSAVAD